MKDFTRNPVVYWTEIVVWESNRETHYKHFRGYFDMDGKLHIEEQEDNSSPHERNVSA